MKFDGIVKFSVAIFLASALVGMSGCGGSTEIQPEPTPEMMAEPEPMPEEAPEPEMQRYSVMQGDSLWDISGMADIYGDNFQWPLVFKANRDQIEDPDIIEIGQDLAISREFSAEEVEMAIENARRTPRYVPHTQPRQRLPIEY